MRLFTCDDRERIKNELIELFSEFKEVISVILVGSASIGFTDEISDLDFCIVVENNSNIGNLIRVVNEKIKDKYPVMDLLEVPQRGLSVCILYNFLEIDIGFTTIDNLTARRGRWMVVYDSTNKTDEVMRQSWEINKNNKGKTGPIDARAQYVSIAEDIWHYLFHAIAGIKREKYWRVIGEMDIARNMLIELLGYKYSLETKRFRDVDEFPPEVKSILERTFAVNLNQKDLIKCLHALINAIYTELDEYFASDNHVVKVGRNDVLIYFSEVLGNPIK